jgi:hypothetical protein
VRAYAGGKSKGGGRTSAWGDLYPSRFPESVCCRYVAYPDPHVEPEEGEEDEAADEEVSECMTRRAPIRRANRVRPRPGVPRT